MNEGTAGRGRRLVFRTAGGVFLVLILLFYLSSVRVSLNSESCAKCHVMEPYFDTWQKSQHAGVDCYQCHDYPGTSVVALLNWRIQAWWAKSADSPELPIVGTREIASETCLQCHSLNRTITPSTDLDPAFHAAHVEYGTRCADCHHEVTHAGLSVMDPVPYTAELGKIIRQAEQTDFLLSKGYCAECHDGERVANSCSYCHTTMVIPDNHAKTGFGIEHGGAAHKELPECLYCHTYGNAPEQSITMASQIASSKFCYDCHVIRPPSHRANDWFRQHTIIGREDQFRCLACHEQAASVEKRRDEEIIACGACHR